MKLKSLFLLTTLLVVFTLVGCNSAGEIEPAVEGQTSENQDETLPPATDIETDNLEDGDQICPATTAGMHLLVDSTRGYCFLYPENYDVFQGEDGGYSLYVRSLLNTEAPVATFSFTPTGGQSLADLAAQNLVNFSLPESAIHSVELDGVPAIMLDNIPGQDTSRQLMIVHNDLAIDMLVTRIGAEYGEIGEQAGYLYITITESFRFISPIADAPLQAGPECPMAVEGQFLFTNVADGYCLLLPDSYSVDDSLVSDNGGRETAIYVGSLMDVTHPHLFITVVDANGQTLEEITITREEELQSTGFDVMWSFGYMLDGVAANQFDQVPGQDLSRQVVMVHDGRLYTLAFVPDDQSAGDAYAEMQTLYDLVMDSFSFTWPAPASGTVDGN
jgi:hypothetical protein